MQCPECSSTHICKNGKKQGKQNHICIACSLVEFGGVGDSFAAHKREV